MVFDYHVAEHVQCQGFGGIYIDDIALQLLKFGFPGWR